MRGMSPSGPSVMECVTESVMGQVEDTGTSSLAPNFGVPATTTSLRVPIFYADQSEPAFSKILVAHMHIQVYSSKTIKIGKRA